MDWSKFIDQLVEREGTLYKVAQRSGVGYNTLYALHNKRNKQPRWDIGEQIIKFERNGPKKEGGQE